MTDKPQEGPAVVVLINPKRHHVLIGNERVFGSASEESALSKAWYINQALAPLVAKAALADEMATELFRLHRDVCDECETFGKCHSAKLIYRYDRLHEKEKGKGTP